MNGKKEKKEKSSSLQGWRPDVLLSLVSHTCRDFSVALKISPALLRLNSYCLFEVRYSMFSVSTELCHTITI
jgi:hypothetical protein